MHFILSNSTTLRYSVSYRPLLHAHRATIHSYLFPAVPPPTVIVQSDNQGVAVVAGTPHNLTCTVSLSNVDDIMVMVDFTWSISMSPILSSNRITMYHTSQYGNQSTYTSTLMLNPLSSSTDTGQYVCSVGVSSYPADPFITQINASNSTHITVQRESVLIFFVRSCDSTNNPHSIALPLPAVMVNYNGTMSIGSFLTLSCEVQVVEGLIVQPDIVWTKRAVSDGGGNSIISVGQVRTNNALTLTFNELNTSDAGEYTCTAAVNVSVINLSVITSSKLDARIQSKL